MELKIGTRLRCGSCGSEAILTKAGDSELSCCGQPLLDAATGAPAAPSGGS